MHVKIKTEINVFIFNLYINLYKDLDMLYSAATELSIVVGPRDTLIITTLFTS